MVVEMVLAASSKPDVSMRMLERMAMRGLLD
jgi:hypothetical protein